MGTDREPQPREHHITVLRNDLVDGIKAALPILRKHGLGSYDLQREDVEDGQTRVKIIGDPGRMDPVVEIANILEDGNVAKPNRAQQLADLNDRIGTTLAGMVENARHPRIQSALDRTNANLRQLRSGNFTQASGQES